MFALRLEATAAELDIPILCEQARLLVPVTFSTIVGTVLFYGLTAGPIAQRLGLAEANPQGVLIVGAHQLAREIARVLRAHKVRVLLVDTNHAEVMAARLAELPTFHGNILGEDALEELDLGGIGRLLALTPNDEVNILTTQRLAPLLGRQNVYQLPPPEGARKRTGMARHLAGRRLFSPAATSAHLRAQLDAGALVKATKLTESFNFQAFRKLYGPAALPLFVLSESGRLTIRTADQTSEPKPGQTLISLVAEPPAKPTATTET